MPLKGVVRRLGNVICACRHQWLTRWPPKRQQSFENIKTPREVSAPRTITPNPLRIPSIRTLLDLRSINYTAPMFPSGFTGFDINNLPGLHNDGYCDDFGFNGPDWNVAGPSQPYTGVDVRET